MSRAVVCETPQLQESVSPRQPRGLLAASQPEIALGPLDAVARGGHRPVGSAGGDASDPVGVVVEVPDRRVRSGHVLHHRKGVYHSVIDGCPCSVLFGQRSGCHPGPGGLSSTGGLSTSTRAMCRMPVAPQRTSIR